MASPQLKIRIGHGLDVHRFSDEVNNEGIILGGVKIDYEKSLLAHSDGDVLLHAISDALLGAVGLGDIGRHFPDTDPQFSGISSLVLLDHVVSLLKQKGWLVQNIDATIVAQAPKMLPHIPKMKQLIAQSLGVTIEDVNVKATTTEKLGFVGRREGIEVHAVAMIYQPNDV